MYNNTDNALYPETVLFSISFYLSCALLILINITEIWQGNQISTEVFLSLSGWFWTVTLAIRLKLVLLSPLKWINQPVVLIKITDITANHLELVLFFLFASTSTWNKRNLIMRINHKYLGRSHWQSIGLAVLM